MKISRLLFAATLFFLVPLSATAQVNDTYVITASANTSGSFGTRWLTSFSIFNPHLGYPLTVSITYLPAGGAQGIEELVDLPPNSLAYSDDLLWDLFGATGSGALLVATFASDNPGVPNTVLARSFVVTSNTYNNSPDGTYGQTIPGVWTGLLDYDSDGITSIAHGVRNRTQDGWRTNVGAVNLGRCAATVWVSVYDVDGNLVVEDPMIVPPLGAWQEGLPVQIAIGTVEFSVEDPCANDDERYAVVFPYTSTIDQFSGDPTYQSPTLLAQPGSIFSKAAAADPTQIGRKIDSTHALRVRAKAARRGHSSLTRTEKGWQIGR